MKLGMCGALCLLAAGFSARAAAQEGGQQAFAQAEAAFQRGEQLFSQGNAQGAEAEFRSAHDLMRGHPNQPLILANIARCVEQQGGRDSEALALYEQMIRETEALAAQNEGARNARHDAEQHAAALRARGVSTGPAISPIGLIVLGVGAAVAIAGAIAGGVALAQRGSVLSMCTDTACPPETRDEAREIDDIALAADVLLFGGIGIAAVGLILTLVLPSDGGGMQAAASCGPTGCYALLGGSFR